MSTCISRHGEYGDHTLDTEYTCTRCGVLDEDALTEELRGLRQELDEARAERERFERDVATALNVDDWEHPADLFRMVRALRLSDEQDAELLSGYIAERDRMCPVVEAAEQYRRLYATDLTRETCYLAFRQRALLEAVDAYRSATPDAEPAPGVPVDTTTEGK